MSGGKIQEFYIWFLKIPKYRVKEAIYFYTEGKLISNLVKYK